MNQEKEKNKIIPQCMIINDQDFDFVSPCRLITLFFSASLSLSLSLSHITVSLGLLLRLWMVWLLLVFLPPVIDAFSGLFGMGLTGCLCILST